VCVPFALYGYQCKVMSLPQANFLRATEPRASRPEHEGRPMVQVVRRSSSRTVAWNARLGRAVSSDGPVQPNPLYPGSAGRPWLLWALGPALERSCAQVAILDRGNAPSSCDTMRWGGRRFVIRRSRSKVDNWDARLPHPSRAKWTDIHRHFLTVALA
jgi:hypothetical protein